MAHINDKTLTLLKELTQKLQEVPLSISSTRRAGTNGLRNAEEVAAALMPIIEGAIFSSPNMSSEGVERWQPKPVTFRDAVCRGSIVLGTACGKCERCEYERARLRPANQGSGSSNNVAPSETVERKQYLREGHVRKGGINSPVSQIKERPPAPASMVPASSPSPAAGEQKDENRLIQDMAMLIRRMARRLGMWERGHALARDANSFLIRHNLQGSFLRASSEATQD